MLKKLALIFIASLVGGQAVAGPTIKDPFSLDVTAMINKAGETDVTITTTPKASDINAPGEAKHIQLKSFDTEGELRWTKNVQDHALSVSNNVAHTTLSYDDMARFQPIKIQEQVQTSQITRTKVLRASTVVLNRPDVAINGVTVPETAMVNQVINLDVALNEIAYDLGAQTSVVLSHDGNVLDRADGVLLAKGGDAVVTMSLAFDAVGTYTIDVEATNVLPGDFDYSNNSTSFTIEIVDDVEKVQTYLSYYFQDYTASSYYNHPSWSYNESHYDIKAESLWQYHQIPGQAWEFPVDLKADVSIDGAAMQTIVDLTDLTPTWSYTSGCYSYKGHSAQVGDGLYVYVYTYDYCGTKHSWAQFHDYAADSIWHSTGWNQYNGNYSYHHVDQRGQFHNAQSSVATRFVVTDNNSQGYGGDFSMNLTQGSLDYDYSYDYGNGYTHNYHRRGYYIRGWKSGMTE